MSKRTLPLAWGAVLLGLGALFLTQAKAPAVWAVVGSVLVVGTARFRVEFSARRSLALLSAGVGTVIVAALLLVMASRWLPEDLRIGTIVTRLVLDSQAVDFLRSHHYALIFGGAVSEFQSYSGLDLGLHNEYLSQVLRNGLPAAILFCILMLRSVAVQARLGWPYSLPLIMLALILLLESASGTQLQTVVFMTAGFADCYRRVERGDGYSYHSALPKTWPADGGQSGRTPPTLGSG